MGVDPEGGLQDQRSILGTLRGDGEGHAGEPLRTVTVCGRPPPPASRHPDQGRGSHDQILCDRAGRSDSFSTRSLQKEVEDAYPNDP